MHSLDNTSKHNSNAPFTTTLSPSGIDATSKCMFITF
jgi:hypothetical protein